MRCIKPNEMKSPVLFDDARCQHQVAYLGLLENVMVRRAGFAYRQSYARFLQRWVTHTHLHPGCLLHAAACLTPGAPNLKHLCIINHFW